MGDQIFCNDGGDSFSNVGVQLDLSAIGGPSAAALGDYDNDGDLDIAAGSRLYKNDGVFSFTQVNANLPVAIGKGAAAWGDYDNDGDVDLALAGHYGQFDVRTRIYRNEGNDQFQEMATVFRGTAEGDLEWVDFDEDGDLDLSVTGYDVVDGGPGIEFITKLYRNDGVVFNSPPNPPTVLSAESQNGEILLGWSAVTGDETPSLGLSYNLRIGTSPGGSDVRSGMAASSGHRLVAALGNAQKRLSWTIGGLNAGTYYWSVQAIDSGFMASAWAAEESIVVNQPPLANDDTFVVFEDSSLDGTLVAADSDGHELTFSIVEHPTMGTAVITDPVTGAFTYVPYPNENGQDSLRFKASDGIEDSNTATIAFTVAPKNDQPTVEASASPAEVLLGHAVFFAADGHDIDEDALSYTWDFGDGTGSDIHNPSHTYASAGTYMATATVNDGHGGTANASVTIIVDGDNDGDGTLDADDPDDDNDGVPDTVDLDMDGDGATNDAEKLAGTDPNDSGSVPANVQEDPRAPTARFTTSDVVGFVDRPLAFDATYSTDPENAIISYTWNFSDSSPQGAGQLISRAYAQDGAYTVTLTVVDAEGLSDTATRTLQVLPEGQFGLFNAEISYKAKWNRGRENRDSFMLTSVVNVGDYQVAGGTPVAVEIAGYRFEGTLNLKLRDRTDRNEKWIVKAGLRKQALGEVWLKLRVKRASLGLGFNQAGAVAGPDNEAELVLPLRIEIGDRSFELAVPSEFTFKRSGTKAKGTGQGP